MNPNRPRYSTWIRRSKIAQFWALAAALLALGGGLAMVWLPLALLGLAGLPFLYIAGILTVTAHRFSDHGGGVQNLIHEALLASLGSGGPLLDIGCGSGRLILRAARSFPGPHVGLDYWGDDWEYSRSQCETNARLEGVAGVTFVKASASALPFPEASVDNVVSCLTFHEVGDVTDKTVSLTEALRVLKPGGRFAFLDLFADPQFYPGLGAVRAAIEGAGGLIERCTPLGELMPLRFPLNGPRVLGYAVLISGFRANE